MNHKLLKKVMHGMAVAGAFAGLSTAVSAAGFDEPSVSNWTGFYVGANIGAGGIVNDISLPGLGAGNFNGIGGEGILVGGMLGFNYQISPKFVVGVQGDIGFTDLETELNIPGLFNLSAKPEFTASISARAGWLATPNSLLYIIGGYSHAEYDVDISIPFIPASVGFKEKYDGFHVGGGIETKVSSNLTARLEYRYTQYAGEDWGTGGFLKVKPSSHTATVGVAWQFYNLASGEVVTPVADLDPPASENSWTGLYAGGWFGAGAIVHDISIPPAGPGNFNGIGGEGVLGGGMVGFNYQISPEFVVGIQGDVGFSDLETKLSIPGLITAKARPGFIASISGRAGWLSSPDTLLYVLGGYSYADYKLSGTLGLAGVAAPVSFSAKEKFDGFHVGAGIETRLTDNISARVEYRYTEYGGEDWGTGFLDVEPSSHTGTIGIAWNFGNLL